MKHLILKAPVPPPPSHFLQPSSSFTAISTRISEISLQAGVFGALAHISTNAVM